MKYYYSAVHNRLNPDIEFQRLTLWANLDSFMHFSNTSFLQLPNFCFFYNIVFSSAKLDIDYTVALVLCYVLAYRMDSPLASLVLLWTFKFLYALAATFCLGMKEMLAIITIINLLLITIKSE